MPRRLYYPVEYNPTVDNRQAEYEQRRRKQEAERRRRLRQHLMDLEGEQYEMDSRTIMDKGRR